MKITGVETVVITLPMVIGGATPMLGGKARTSIDMLLVRVDTDAGVTGWGEAFGHRIFHATRAAIDTLLGPMCITYAQPSVTKIGGVTEMRRVMTLADAFGVPVVPHSAYFGPGLLASIHCIAAMRGESLVERFYCDFEDNPLGDAIHPQNGRIAVPQGPGLGVDPDPRVVDRLRSG